MHARALIVLALITALAASGCGGVVGPSQNTIEEFTGFVDPNGEGPQHDFTVQRNGEFELRFLALDPPAGLLQVFFGQYFGGTCQQFLAFGFGGQNSILLTGAISTGRYCVIAFDENLIAQRVNYTLRVSHP